MLSAMDDFAFPKKFSANHANDMIQRSFAEKVCLKILTSWFIDELNCHILLF